MRGAVVLGTLLVAGCGGENDGSADAAGEAAERQPVVRAAHGGRIVDLASVLSPADKSALGRRLGGGKPVTVVIVKADKAQSLEQIGWAVGGAAGETRSTLILLDPETRQVRLEGDLTPEVKASVAAVIRGELDAGRVAGAVDRGLSRLEQLAR